MAGRAAGPARSLCRERTQWRSGPRHTARARPHVRRPTVRPHARPRLSIDRPKRSVGLRHRGARRQQHLQQLGDHRPATRENHALWAGRGAVDRADGLRRGRRRVYAGHERAEPHERDRRRRHDGRQRSGRDEHLQQYVRQRQPHVSVGHQRGRRHLCRAGVGGHLGAERRLPGGLDAVQRHAAGTLPGQAEHQSPTIRPRRPKKPPGNSR